MVMSIRNNYSNVIVRNKVTKQSEINVLRLLHPTRVGFAMTNDKMKFLEKLNDNIR